MKKDFLEAKKNFGLEFLNAIEKYKSNKNLSYKELAHLTGINEFYFANLRYKIKKMGVVPTEKILKKFEKIL